MSALSATLVSAVFPARISPVEAAWRVGKMKDRNERMNRNCIFNLVVSRF